MNYLTMMQNMRERMENIGMFAATDNERKRAQDAARGMDNAISYFLGMKPRHEIPGA